VPPAEQPAAPARRTPARRYNQREGRTLLEVLQDFPSAQPPLAWLLQAAPLLRPRLFSISSGPALHPRAAHVTAAVVRWTTPFRRAKLGLCSAWLAGLQPAGQQRGGSGGGGGGGGGGGSRAPVWVERGSLRLPADAQVPLLLVGPGTGVAPFRSFLQQRQVQAEAAAAAGAPPPAPCVLFFGCRSAAADFYYADEWRALQAAGVLHPQHGLQAAFSRDQPAKVYVTHCIRRQAALVWALLQQGARVYVAGSADRMPADVAAAFRDVAAQQGGLGAAEAERFVRQLQLGGRYFVEAWS
jgi:sulfite reductase alpha subunit-like flavoprotein